MEITKATTRETTILLKKYLKEKYGINVSVRSRKYAGGSNLDVDYVLGPGEKTVESELKRLQWGNFDGMIDCYMPKEDSDLSLVLNGKKLQEFSYVFVNQSISKKVWFQIAKLLSLTHNIEGTHKIETFEDFERNFLTCVWDSWNWSQLAWKLVKKLNFITQDENKIKVLEICGDMHHYHVKYEVDGVVYSSDEFKPKNTTVKKTPRTEINGVRLVDYSEKAIAVLGDSREIADKLRELGGKWNKFLTFEGKQVQGWIFSKMRESQVADVILDYSKAD